MRHLKYLQRDGLAAPWSELKTLGLELGESLKAPLGEAESMISTVFNSS